MSTTAIPSRIARQLTLRRAEVTAHTASVIAWTLTALLVGAGYAKEANPFSAFLIAQSSVHAWALVTPLLVAGLFAGFRWVRENDDPHAALISGWVVAAALVVDAAGNLLGTAVVGLPTFRVAEFGGFVAALVGLAGVCVARPSPSTVREFVAAPPRPSAHSRQAIVALGLALLLLTSLPAPFTNLSAVGNVSAETSPYPNGTNYNYSATPSGWSASGETAKHDIPAGNGDETYKWNLSIGSAQTSKNIFSMVLRDPNTGSNIGFQITDDYGADGGGSDYIQYTVNGSAVDSDSWGGDSYVYENTDLVVELTYSDDNTSWKFDLLSPDGTRYGGFSESETSSSWIQTNFTAENLETHKMGGLVGESYVDRDVSIQEANSRVQIRSIDSDTPSNYRDNYLTNFATTATPSTSFPLNGTVENQAGQPISNATVQLTISKQPTVPQADSQLDTLSNPIPSAYTNQLGGGFSLLGDDGFAAQKGGQYAAIYSPSDLGLTYKQSGDLRDPKISDIEPGTEQAIILADTEADCGVAGFETNEYNRQIPGCVQQDGNVTIEKLSSTGEVTSTDEVSVEEAGNQRDFGGPTDIHYATYTFTTGIYRISPPNGASYLVKAGTPTPDFNQYEQTLENHRTQQAQAIQDALNQDTLVVKTVATNETGHWNASVSSNAKVIAVSARKAPGVDVSPENLTYDNMSAAYNAEDAPNASVYLPSTTKRVEPGASNVDITLREVAFPSFANIDKLQQRIQELRNRLNNLTLDDLPQQLLQRLETESADDLRRTWSSMRGTLTNFEPAREAYLDISDRDSVPTAEELSKSELQTAIRNANLAITQSASTAQATETVSETTQDTVTQAWELSGIDVDAANMSVVADYSNGTSRVVSDEYVTVDSNIGRADEVRVEGFPLGEDDPEQVQFQLRVAGNDELATTASTMMNPTFTGSAPTIDAVELTSLAPGPSDRVTVDVKPDSASSFREVTTMTVYGPSGKELQTSNITDGTEASFTTNGEGVHSIRFTVDSTSGATFTDVVRVEASSSDETMRPSVYARSGPLGTYAVVGDGFESGDVEVADDGSVEVVGMLGTNADVPNTVDVFTEGLETGAEATTTVRIVSGESRESVRKNIPVVVHGPRLNSPDDGQSGKAIAYANSQPVTWSGETRFGVIEQDGDGSSIHAYTATDGVLRLEVDNNPDWLERQRFWLSQNAPWVPGIGFVSGTTLFGGFVLVRRRGAAN